MREHRHRNRRIGLALFALTLGAAGVGVVWGAFEDGRTSPAQQPTTDAAQALPDTAEVRCDEDGTTVLTPSVRARADGVHIRIDNQTDRPLKLDLRGYGDVEAAPGISQVAWPLAPGMNSVACFDPYQVDDPIEFAPLGVVDENGLWVSPDLECNGEVRGGGLLDHLAPGLRGRGDPIDVARRQLEGLRADDTVEPAGYPSSDPRSVRVVRARRTVASASYLGQGPNEWLLVSLRSCEDSGILVPG